MEKRTYSAPVLTVLGRVDQLTQGTMGSFNDGTDAGGMGFGMADLAPPMGP
jgi:hypothetical protein